MIRRLLRALGTVMVALGVGTAVWVAVVWMWKDPFTTLYTDWEQHKLAQAYDERFHAWHDPAVHVSSAAAARRELAREARRYRLASHEGEAIGRRGVLGTVGRAIVKQKLPFTGLPPWPMVLIALGLIGCGLVLRRTAVARKT